MSGGTSRTKPTATWSPYSPGTTSSDVTRTSVPKPSYRSMRSAPVPYPSTGRPPERAELVIASPRWLLRGHRLAHTRQKGPVVGRATAGHLEHRHVPGLGVRHRAGAVDPVGPHAGGAPVDEPVLLAPHHEGRRSDLMEPVVEASRAEEALEDLLELVAARDVVGGEAA